MTITFYCPCGFHYEGDGPMSDLNHEPLDDGCCNCGGRKCMDCVLRYWHDDCVDDCPACCLTEADA